MATELSYIQFVCEQLRGEEATYKKMFGEYMVYVEEKPVLLVCNNTVYVKRHEALWDLLGDAETGVPYGGAKEHYILDIEDSDLTEKVIAVLKEVTPLPKKRVKKS